jgi:glycosyltransferase involved in cell wall biosynthesis
MTVSIVVPCYNLQQGWEKIVFSNYQSFCSRTGVPVSLILVMDGAVPEPSAIAFLTEKISAIKLVTYPINAGKGYAIRQGVKEAKGDIIIYTDVDFPYTENSLHAVYQSLANDECDVAVGIKNDAYYEHVPAVRNFISRGLRFCIRLFLSVPITDTQCGLKGFKKEVTALFLQTTINRYLFDLEFIRNCFKDKKFRMKTIPLTLKDNVHFSKVNYRILFSESVNFLRLLTKR